VRELWEGPRSKSSDVWRGGVYEGQTARLSADERSRDKSGTAWGVCGGREAAASGGARSVRSAGEGCAGRARPGIVADRSKASGGWMSTGCEARTRVYPNRELSFPVVAGPRSAEARSLLSPGKGRVPCVPDTSFQRWGRQGPAGV
jgi:hypothetical protein